MPLLSAWASSPQLTLGAGLRCHLQMSWMLSGVSTCPLHAMITLS